MDEKIVLEKETKVREMLNSVEREGMPELIKYMERKGFFTAPASTKFHGVFKGGLLIHSYNIYLQFKKHCIAYKIPFSEESMIICAFGHDLCKAGMYIEQTKNRYRWNNFNGVGHAKLSIERLKRFIELKPEEETIIKYHMGFYGTTEFNGRGEYTLHELVEAYNNLKVAKLFYFCDDLSTQFLEKN